MQLRHCSAGNHNVPETGFWKRGNSFQPNCKECQKQINKNRYASGKADHIRKTRGRIKDKIKILQEWKQHIGCSVCGETHRSCLDFHHLDPTIKELSLGVAFSRAGVGTVLEELAKCVVLCKNCHCKEHDGVLNRQLSPIPDECIKNLEQQLLQ